MNTNIDKLDNISLAFGISLVFSMLFNSILACVKDAYEPLNKFMASIFGHHWITHGIFDVFVFILVGILMIRFISIDKIKSTNLSRLITISAIVSALSLIGWFFLF